MKKQIFLIFILAFILRIIFIPQGAVSFHYDMSRDAFIAREIWQDGDFKILGPPTSTPGIYHGVLYYYLISIPYGISNGDPKAVAVFLSFLASLTIIPIFLLARNYFKKTLWALICSLLFAFSFEAVQYGSWLSNPSPALLTVGLYFYSLWLWRKGEVKGLYFASFLSALSANFQFFLIYLIFLIPIFGYLFKLRFTLRNLLVSSFFVVLGLSSLLFAAVKFKTIGLIFSGFSKIAQNQQLDFHSPFSEFLLTFINNFSNLFVNNFLPTNIFLGGFLGWIVLYLIRKEKFLLFCLFSNLPIYFFGGHSNIYGSIGLVVPAILGVSILIQRLSKIRRLFGIILLTLIIISNLYAIYKISPQGQITLVIPNDMLLKNELSLIDETYRLSDGQPFSINTLTLPLWTNTTWAYLYSWYGNKKYGYVPSFYGHNQIGLLGENELQKVDKPFNKTFFILEPHVGIRDEDYKLEIGSENSKTDLISEIKYGDLILQYRKPKNE